MQALRTAIWVVIAVILAWFAFSNWQTVAIDVFGRLYDVVLPLLVFGSFLMGLVPMWLAYRTTRWTLLRRAETAERSLADLRASVAMPSPSVGAGAVPLDAGHPAVPHATGGRTGIL